MTTLSTFLGTDFSGFTGSSGPSGFTGSQGEIGYTGSQGDIGFTGSAGTIGIDGFTGSQGYTGSQGVITEPSATPPSNPVNGQLWFDTNDGTVKVYYVDVDTSQWVVVSGPIGPTGYTGSASDGLASSGGFEQLFLLMGA